MKNVFLALILFCIMTGLAKGKTPLYYGPKKNLEFKVHDPSFQVATTVITLASSTPGIQFHFPLTLDDVTATSTPTNGASLYSLNGKLVETRDDGTNTFITDTPTALLSSTSELTTSGGAVILSATSSGDYTFTFPSAAGASGTVLTADGNGGHTYETPSAGSGGREITVLEIGAPVGYGSTWTTTIRFNEATTTDYTTDLTTVTVDAASGTYITATAGNVVLFDCDLSLSTNSSDTVVIAKNPTVTQNASAYTPATGMKAMHQAQGANNPINLSAQIVLDGDTSDHIKFITQGTAFAVGTDDINTHMTCTATKLN